jgi:prepilin-type N-terminal cleavage/methylation domain-containing protein
MTNRKSRGFTLIELLVVIAIIAILAAILFPVFAQAKRAAKGAVAVSDAKQMALAELMYTNDFDDAFTPILRVDKSYQQHGGTYYWSYLLQPYIKNWSIFADPTGPNVPVGSQDNTDSAESAFSLYGMWGAPPERIDSAISTSASQWTFGQQPLGKQMTGGQLWYYDGIMGLGMNAESWWSTWYYKGGGGSGMTGPQSVPSLTTTSIANPADQVMVAQSGTEDFMWENNGNGSSCDISNAVCIDTPDNFDLYYGGCGSNTYGCEYTICAPIARQRDTDGNSVGFFPFPGNPNYQIPATQTLPTGLTAWSGTDGHTKVTPWRKLMGTTIPINGGANLAIKAFWPSGS